MKKEYKKLYKGVFDEIYPAEDLREKLNCKSFKHKKLKISWVAIIMMFVIVGTATGIEAAMNHFSFLNFQTLEYCDARSDATPRTDSISAKSRIACAYRGHV